MKGNIYTDWMERMNLLEAQPDSTNLCTAGWDGEKLETWCLRTTGCQYEGEPSRHTQCCSIPLPLMSLERGWAERALLTSVPLLCSEKKKKTSVYSRNCEPFTPNPHPPSCKVCLAWKLRVYVFVPDHLDSPPRNQLSTCLGMPNVEGAPTDKTLMFCKILFSVLGRITLLFQFGKVPLYQPQVLCDFPAANNLTLLLALLHKM